MITIGNFTGKLGNQLFQIAAAYTHAKENGVEFLCPEWKYQKYFKLKHKTYQGEPIQQFYSEHGFHYTPIPFKDNTALNGYYQSEKYFNKSIIEELFQFDINENKVAFTIPYANKICSVHVRRGDYLNYPDHHPVLSLSYYEDAINFAHHRGCDTYIIFSDDIPWCINNFKGIIPVEDSFVMFSRQDEMSDFYLMSQCDYNIIANSTFSWWAAYLNQNPDKIVISPSKDKWHGPAYAHWNHDDIIPESWIQI